MEYSSHLGRIATPGSVKFGTSGPRSTVSGGSGKIWGVGKVAGLERFSPVVREWFASSFASPTPAQTGAWSAIASGEHTLVVAPTGSGKTFAAFLWSIDRLISSPAPPKDRRLRVLYVSPMKALAYDIERNLRDPLQGIGAGVAVAMRTGDTPAEERRRFGRNPPDILITTPESLYLLLTSRARDALKGVELVIVDEVHALAGNKRGAHLALTLERLDELLERPAQRVGLSATVRPVDGVARWLTGGRQATIVQPRYEKRFDVTVVVPVEDMTAVRETSGSLPRGVRERTQETKSVWPAVEARILELVKRNRSTIVFANSRRLAERLCARLNEEADSPIARAHHGSVSREQRLEIESALKEGRLAAVVATSSLELGIDMGVVDLVVQVEAPMSVASGMQRIGRAGHQVGAVSRGVLFPKHRGDLLASAVVTQQMKAGRIEALTIPRNPLDVLAQQVVAMVAMDDWDVDRLEKVVRRAASFADLPRSALSSVLDMLSGRYPSDEFAELRPRLTWDRISGRLTARPGAQRLAVTSGGTIPDRGLYGVFLAGGPSNRRESARVGELDEEMVYESRVGEVFMLGASSWRIEEITRDRVLVSPAPGEPGKMPFWRGDQLGRQAEFGAALGTFTRRIASMPPARATAELGRAGLDALAADNLLRYLADQREATGALPDDRTIVVERFRDTLGDWRVCVHSPFGARVHAPWAQAIEARIRERAGIQTSTMYTDDGIIVRLPESEDPPPATDVVFEPDDVDRLVTGNLPGSALFASRFRECAARALLIPRRRPDRRTPLWEQRLRSADLYQVASKHGSFPVILEAARECLQDVFDLPALRELMAAISRREVRVVEAETALPSPFALSLQFAYVADYLYETDACLLAERRAQALSLDRRLLAELLGTPELRELVDEEALRALEAELQHLTPARAIRDADDLHDALRSLGELTGAEIEARAAEPAAVRGMIEELEGARRIFPVEVAGEPRFAAAEDAPRLRDALGVALPEGIPPALLEPVADALGDLVARYARTHGPFTSPAAAGRLGLAPAAVEEVLRRLEREGRVATGEFRPGGAGSEWVEAEVLRSLRRRSIAAFRREAEPAAPDAFARFLPAWHDVGSPRPAGPDALLRAVDQLGGAFVPASQLERQILPARLVGYTPALLDQLTASGETLWAGGGTIATDDGWVALCPAADAPLVLPHPAPLDALSPLARGVHDALGERGALFFRQIVDALGRANDREALQALWELVWAGHATNDTLAPLRALVAGRGLPLRVRPRGRGPAMPTRAGPPAAAGRWSLLPERGSDHTRRLAATAGRLLDRHGIVVRGSVESERAGSAFGDVYKVLKAMEESGRCRRGYFVEGLGGAQFALPGAVERLRAIPDEAGAVVLAATDPANPYGAALAWPEAPHRTGRKAGASVVLVDGRLAIYLEKGGRSLVVCDDRSVEPALAALVAAGRAGMLGRLAIELADGRPTGIDTPIAGALAAAGLVATPKGFRLR
jgi:ATP-dependent Lhr-like helicase